MIEHCPHCSNVLDSISFCKYCVFPDCRICIAIYCFKRHLKFIKSESVDNDTLCEFHMDFLRRNV
jgi:hypothetical protein